MADQFFESAAALLTAGIDIWHARQIKEKRLRLESLQNKCRFSRGTIVVLKKDLYLREYGEMVHFRWFDVGYAPMILDVHWPKIAESTNDLQSPVVFHLWCSGHTYTHSIREQDWTNDLPFEELCDDKTI